MNQQTTKVYKDRNSDQLVLEMHKSLGYRAMC